MGKTQTDLPQAHTYTRTRAKRWFNPGTGKMAAGVSEEQETVRVASCGVKAHDDSTTFVGVNARGWVFKCRDCGYFLARPATEQRLPT